MGVCRISMLYFKDLRALKWRLMSFSIKGNLQTISRKKTKIQKMEMIAERFRGFVPLRVFDFTTHTMADLKMICFSSKSRVKIELFSIRVSYCGYIRAWFTFYFLFQGMGGGIQLEKYHRL